MEFPEELSKLTPGDALFCSLVSRLCKQVGGERGWRLSVELVGIAKDYVRGVKPESLSVPMNAAFAIVTRFLTLRAPLHMTSDMACKWDASADVEMIFCAFCGAMHPPGYQACEICGDALTSDPGLSFRTLMDYAKAAEAGQKAAAAGMAAWLN